MRKQSSFVILIIAFALVVAACGDDDGGSLLGQSTQAPAGSTAPTSIDDLPIDVGDLPIDVDDFPTDVGDLPGVSGECEALLNLFLSIGGAFLGGSVAALDPGTLASLPPDIREDAQFLSDALTQFSDGLQDLGVDFTDPSSLATLSESQQAALTALTDSLDSERFNTAADNLSEYGEQQCASQFGGAG